MLPHPLRCPFGSLLSPEGKDAKPEGVRLCKTKGQRTFPFRGCIASTEESPPFTLKGNKPKLRGQQLYPLRGYIRKYKEQSSRRYTPGGGKAKASYYPLRGSRAKLRLPFRHLKEGKDNSRYCLSLWGVNYRVSLE